MKNGDFIRIEYVGKLESGEIFDLTDEELAKKEGIYNEKIKYRPVPVIVGAKFVIPGLDKALLDMKIGEKKTILVEPEDAFGKRDPNLVRVMPRSAFKNIEPKQGMIIDFSGVKGRVQSISAGRIMIDFNNPLAGKKLKYDLGIKEGIDNTEGQIKAIFEFFGIETNEIKFNGNTIDIEAMKLPVEIKDRISSLIINYVKSETKIEKVRFIESYGK